MAYQDVFDPVDLSQVRSSMHRLRLVMNQETRRTVQQLTRTVGRAGGTDNMMARMYFPTPRQDRMGVGFTSGMRQRLKRSGQQFKQFMGGMASAAYVKSATKLGDAWETAGEKIEAAGKKAKDAARWVKEAAKAAPGRGMAFMRERAAPFAGRALKGVGKAAVRAGMFGGGALMGFLVSSFREAIGAYEQQQRARIEATQTLGYRARFARGGAALGYNTAEAARIQAQGAAMGIDPGRAGGMASMRLMRVLGQAGMQVGGGIMARGGLTGRGGVGTMMKTLEKTMALAMETGLSRARIGEYLQVANQLSEDQIRTTPDRKSFMDFTKELAFMQARGGPAFKGKFAGQALTQVHQAIKGATGPAQAFMMRAFGFGRGGNLIDVLKRQELGAGGGNIMAIMQQLREEYGGGRAGGLSAAGKLAFKGMGMGSIHMAEKFSQIYLQRQKGTITAKEAQQKIKGIVEEDKLKKMPTIQQQAYKAMASFGDVVARLAGRFDKFASYGASAYGILQSLDKITFMLLKEAKPLAKLIKKNMPHIVKLVKLMIGSVKKIVSLLEKGFGKSTRKMIDSMSGMMEAHAKGKGFFGVIKAGMRPYKSKGGVEDVGTAVRMAQLQRYGIAGQGAALAVNVMAGMRAYRENIPILGKWLKSARKIVHKTMGFDPLVSGAVRQASTEEQKEIVKGLKRIEETIKRARPPQTLVTTHDKRSKVTIKKKKERQSVQRTRQRQTKPQ